MNQNFITWIALLLLTSATYFLPVGFDSRGILIGLLFLTLVKVFLVVFQFMELKKAHWAWLSVVLGVVLIYMGVVIGLLL